MPGNNNAVIVAYSVQYTAHNAQRTDAAESPVWGIKRESLPW
jgi:hypothetical protein